MIELPQLSQVGIVRLSREGGLAYIPGLVPRRVFKLERCSQTLRNRVCRAVEEAAVAGQWPQSASGGDRRFFRIELDLGGLVETGVQSFEVAEADAPSTLVALLQTAVDDSGVFYGQGPSAT